MDSNPGRFWPAAMSRAKAMPFEDLVATGLDGIGPLDPLGGFTVAGTENRAVAKHPATSFLA